MSPDVTSEVEETKFESLTPAPMTSNDQLWGSKENHRREIRWRTCTWWLPPEPCETEFVDICALVAGMSKFSAPIVDPKWLKSSRCEFRMENSNEFKGWHLDSIYSSSPISHLPWPLDAMSLISSWTIWTPEARLCNRSWHQRMVVQCCKPCQMRLT